jgi:predicted flap endonuclease-1-like 5' DNA nuclease
VEADPEGYAGLWLKAAKEGRDVRALTGIYNMLFAEAVQGVDEPHTFDELAKLNRAERRQLMRQLESAGRAEPFSADEWRCQQTQ